MTRIGTIQGNRIELEEPISLPSGTRVRGPHPADGMNRAAVA
jgi:hypothetical protein